MSAPDRSRAEGLAEARPPTATGPPSPSVMPESRPLAPDVFLMLGTKISLLVFQMLVTILVARSLGVEGRGTVAVAFGFTTLLVSFGTVGLQTANPFFAARDPGSIGRIVANSLWLAAILGAVLILVSVGIKAWFPAALRGLGWLELSIVLAGVPITLASTLLQNVLLAEGRMKAYNGVEFAITLAVVASLWVGFAVFQMGVVGALLTMVTISGLGALTFLAMLMRHKPAVRSPDVTLARRMLKYGFRVYVATVIAYLVGRINLVLVNSYLGSSGAGLYSIGVAISDGMHLIPTVVAVNLFPRVVRGVHFEYTAVVFRSVTVLYAIVCVATVPFAGPAIDILFGHQFAGATEIYYWMLPGIFCYGTLNVLGYHFAGRGYPLEAALIWAPGILINVGILAVFLPGSSPYVAAIASSVAYAFVLFLHMRLFAKESGGYRVLIPRPREVLTLAVGAVRALRPAASGSTG